MPIPAKEIQIHKTTTIDNNENSRKIHSILHMSSNDIVSHCHTQHVKIPDCTSLFREKIKIVWGECCKVSTPSTAQA